MSLSDQSQLWSTVSQHLPILGSKIISIKQHGTSYYGLPARVTVQLLSGRLVDYFLKVMQGDLAQPSCEGEYEALKEIRCVCTHAPAPYSWGKYTENGIEHAFLLTEFIKIQKQPADPSALASALATLHTQSTSPTGKFGFHISTVHTHNIQNINFWTPSWCELFTAHLSRIVSHAETHFQWPLFDAVGQLVLSTVVPALLLPLQTNGRTIKPSLVHGDCWDGNTAMGEDGRAYFFDVDSFYAHNEFELGDWRARRHKLSERDYGEAYKKLVPVSEPVEDWDSRNLLYSLTWNICNALFVPGSTQKEPYGVSGYDNAL
ncbi:uncharacterized protein APUU_20339S [Aspergillus puulaauensis]|uniref:protein-ribulosamine 3-kinase n=1 Tax=Aspergillus puulaauensis TaxID=1220207 RepID=A0A7R7XEF4_9EURO|nr:uncharacterized protein APUU_20339S [Aspergillus puulaauensis]BCS19907.1 hypothetical protein APUU_20339S [Aspergillus puulaauensis]